MKSGDLLYKVRETGKGYELLHVTVERVTPKTIFVTPGSATGYRSTVLPAAIGQNFYTRAADALAAFATNCEREAAKLTHAARWALDEIESRR